MEGWREGKVEGGREGWGGMVRGRAERGEANWIIRSLS